MPTLISRHLSWTVVLLLAVAGHAQDLQIKKSITVGGNVVSSTETSIKAARERTVTQSPAGNMISIRQCDLKRTVHINEQAQAYFIAADDQDESAAKVAAMFGGAPAPQAGGYITESTTISDTGERKTINGYSARHLMMKVSVQPSKNACSQQAQEFEVDGWYADLSKEISACQQYLPPVRQNEGCNDRVIHKVSGTGKPGYPLNQIVTVHTDDGSTMQIGVQVSEITKQDLAKELFDVPMGYHEVKSLAELSTVPVPAVQALQPAPSSSNQQIAMAATKNAPKMSSLGAMLFNPGAQMAKAQNAAMLQKMTTTPTGGGNGTMMGQGIQSAGAAPVPAPQQLGPKAPGKIRVGVAPPDAQLGQGNSSGTDYSTPIRNVEVVLMSGPAVEIAALDSHVPLQLQAEAQQKQCDFILYSGVIVKHSSAGNLGKFMKIGSTAANFTPAGMMAHGVGSVMAAQAAAQAAGAAASQMAQQQAVSQLAGFNGQIKSKDDVTVQYQLVATGQNAPVVQNTLQGKAKSDGEDVLTPLLQQTANAVLTQVSQK